MSKRTSHPVDLQISKVGRRRQARRSHAIFEALEIRRLLSGYTFDLNPQTGGATANGSYLQALVNGTTTITGDGVTNHTVALGDTLILPSGVQYDMGAGELKLPDLGAAATVTETGGVVNNSAVITFAGGGYTAAPTVVLFGGGGSGASATATINTTTDQVTGISITHGGTGYTAAPTVALEGGAGMLTIESAGYANNLLGSGRYNPATTSPTNLAQITSNDPDGFVVTELSDSYNHSGAAENYSLDGIEICPDADTDLSTSAYVQVGSSGSAQDNPALVPTNFILNQDYIHGGTMEQTSDDDSAAALNTNYDCGISLDGYLVTIENSQISDIHANGVETHGVGGVNGLGNYTINNNYIEATGEGVFFGGAASYLPSPIEQSNITITNNLLTKNLAWNPNLPQYGGVPMDVKNDLELKVADNVTVSQNIFQNVWVGGDQRGQAINISNIDSGAKNPWSTVEDVTITDNIFRNTALVIEIAAGSGDQYYKGSKTGTAGYTEFTNNIIFDNNLAYDIGGFQWGVAGTQEAIAMDSATGPSENVTIENNTIIGADGMMFLESDQGSTLPTVANFVCINNVFDYSTSGIGGNGEGSNDGTLNSTLVAGLTITNPGSGYTAAPTVSFSGGGATGTNVATATAYIWGSGFPLAGQLMYVQINSYGSGYTSAPTISFNNTGTGGSGAAVTALPPVSGSNFTGQIHGYEFNNNVIMGGNSNNFPNNNYFPATEDAAKFLDIAGDEYGLLPTSPYYTDGTGGSTPGVNMAALTPGGSTPWQPSDAANSLQNYYKFDEGSGTTSADNGLGTTKTATLSSSSLWTTSGQSNDGIALTGSTSGSVSVPSFTADSSFTFAAWVKPTSTSGTQYIASTANNAFSLYLSGSNLIAKGTTGTITGPALTAGQWSLVAATFNGTTLTLYINGASVGSSSATTTTGTTTLYIGGDQGSVNSFNGTLDEVRYYSSALSGAMQVNGDAYLGLAGGSGYSTNTAGFAVSFTGGGGSGAAGTAYANNADGEITAIIMSNAGSGYTSAPTLSFTNGGGVGALDVASMTASPMSYLYAQYGPQYVNTYPDGENLHIKGTSTSLNTAVITPDEANSAVTQAWSVVTWPQGVNKPTVATGNNPAITFFGAGSYLFQCVATNSVGQSATLEYPLTVLAIPTANISISPASVTLAAKATQQFTVNGTSIANLSGIVDQFGNSMPSSGWTWAVTEPEYGTITGTGLYTASSYYGSISSAIQLNFTTPDGVNYTESTAAVDIIAANTPNAPQNLAVNPSSNTNILTWSAPTGGGQTGYYVESSPDNNGDYTTIATASSTATSFSDTSETAGTTWYYEVQAFNTNGGGGTAGPVEIITGTPAVPSNLLATASINSVGLTWNDNAGTNAAGVHIWRSTNPADSSWIDVSGNLSSSTNSWTDNAANDSNNTPVNGTTYYYYVTSYDSTGDSLGSNTSSATPFGVPTNLTATGIASNQMAVSWDDPSNGVASFYLQYENANGGSWSSPISVGAGTTYYLLTSGVSADTQYNVEIEAYTSVGNSGWSSPASGRTFNSNSALTAYEGFNYPTTGSSTELNGLSGGVGWSGNWSMSGLYPTKYTITPSSLVDTNSTVGANLLTTGGGMNADVPDSTKALRTLSSTVGGGTTTVWASALIEPTNTVSGIISLVGTSGTTTTNLNFGFPVSSEFSVQINSGTHATDTAITPTVGNTYFVVLEVVYGTTDTLNLYVDPNPAQSSGSWTLGAQVTTTGLPVISSVSILGAGNGGGVSNWDEVRVGTSAGAVAPLAQSNAPTGLSTTGLTNGVSLNWSVPSNPAGSSLVSGYDVWRSTSTTSGATWTEIGTAVSGTNYTDSSAVSGTTYYYEVTAENTTSDSVNSNIESGSYVTSPAVPTITSAIPGANSISVSLTWSESSTGSIDYNIQRSTSGTGGWTTVATGVTGTNWVDNAANDPSHAPAGNTPYYYQVDAYYAPSGTPSAWSASSAKALTIPAAPTSLTATPGTNSIALQWTDPSPTTNITGYQVWRSTDDTNWGTSAYATVTGANATSFTDTSVNSSQGTTYYYEVDAYDVTGDSNFATLPSNCGAATVIAYDGFNYSSVSNWNGGNTGVGTGVWTLTNTTHAGVNSGSLIYSSGGNALTTSGNSVTLTALDRATDTLASSVGFTGTTLWVGFEFSTTGKTAELDLGSSQEIRLGGVFSNNVDAKATVNGTAYFLDTTLSTQSNTTYFEVYKINFSTSGDVITMYNDPTPGTAAPTNTTGSLTLPQSAQLSETNILSLQSDVSTDTGTFDEIRLGNSYGSVAPDPKVVNNSKRRQRTPFRVLASSDSSDLVTKVVNAGAYNFYPNSGAWQFSESGPNDLLLGSASGNNGWVGLFN